MRTPLTAAVGLLIVAGVVVGVTAGRAGSGDEIPVQPIRVEAPAAVDPAAPVPVVPAVPPERSGIVPEQVAPGDPDGYVAPPPADDDDDDDDDGPDDDGPDDDD